MATQIAATPIISGTEAINIYKEAIQQPSAKAIEGANELTKFFEKMLIK